MNNLPWNKLARNVVRKLNFKSLIRYIFLSMMLFLSILIFSTQFSSLMFALRGEAQTTSARILDSLSEKLLPSLVTGDYELAQKVIDTSINDVNISDVKLIITDKLSSDTIVITPKRLSDQSAFSQWLAGYAPKFLSDLALPAFNAGCKAYCISIR